MGVGVFVHLLCALLFQSDADTTVLLPSFVPDATVGVSLRYFLAVSVVCVCVCVCACVSVYF
jgi:hypothetical protein